MEILLDELSAGLPDSVQAARILIRVLTAMFVGALFVLAPLEAGMTLSDASRIIQGVATGIGFLGAGAILKLTNEHATEIKGLTTAASIWMTAAVGLAVLARAERHLDRET